jgi:hypothetical protein
MRLNHSVSPNINSSSYSSKASQFWRSLKVDRFLQVSSSICDAFINSLNMNSEPKFVWKHNQQGQSYLEVYDSIQEKYWHFKSEQEALVWLEKRHHIHT